MPGLPRPASAPGAARGSIASRACLWVLGGSTMIYQFGEGTVDTSVSDVQGGGHSLRLRPKVFRVCLYLLEHRDRTILLSPISLPTPYRNCDNTLSAIIPG